MFYTLEKLWANNLKMEIDKLSEEIKNSFFKDLEKLGFANTFNVPPDYLVGNKRLFGTYYSLYLAEFLNFDDKKQIIEIGNAYLFGRAFVIAQDQVLDNLHNPNKDYILISPFLLKEFIIKLEKLIKEFHLESNLNEILLDSIRANKNEQELHKNKITPYTKKDVQNLYLKTGIVDFPVTLFCRLSNQQTYQDLLLSIIRKILICIQICDDLADVAEDYNSGNYTLPVTHGILLSKEGKVSLENMYEGLLLSGLLESLVSFVVKTLDEVLEGLTRISDKKSELGIYSLSLRNYIKKILKEIEEMKENKKIKIFYDEDFTKLEPIKEQKEHRNLIHFLKKLEPSNIAPEKIIS